MRHRQTRIRPPTAAVAGDARPVLPPANLDDTTVCSLFSIGLQLQQVLPATHGSAEKHLGAAIDELDGLILAIRAAVFAADQRVGAVVGNARPATRSPSPASLAPIPGDAVDEKAAALRVAL